MSLWLFGREHLLFVFKKVEEGIIDAFPSMYVYNSPAGRHRKLIRVVASVEGN